MEFHQHPRFRLGIARRWDCVGPGLVGGEQESRSECEEARIVGAGERCLAETYRTTLSLDQASQATVSAKWRGGGSGSVRCPFSSKKRRWRASSTCASSSLSVLTVAKTPSTSGRLAPYVPSSLRSTRTR